MNISTSKILLGVSIAAYTYCSWDHLSSNKKNDDGPPKAVALTQAMVNHQEVLALGRDAFESVAIDRGDPNADAVAQALSNSGSGAGQLGSPTVSALSALALQGIFMTPSGHAALISGTPVGEGETATIIGGPKVFVRKIGDDYAVIEAWGQTKVLKLDDPAVAAQAGAPAPTSGGSPAPASTYTPPRAPANTSSGSSPASGNHGGGTDPYAGHRTGHH